MCAGDVLDRVPAAPRPGHLLRQLLLAAAPRRVPAVGAAAVQLRAAALSGVTHGGPQAWPPWGRGRGRGRASSVILSQPSVLQSPNL